MSLILLMGNSYGNSTLLREGVSYMLNVTNILCEVYINKDKKEKLKMTYKKFFFLNQAEIYTLLDRITH